MDEKLFVRIYSMETLFILMFEQDRPCIVETMESPFQLRLASRCREDRRGVVGSTAAVVLILVQL